MSGILTSSTTGDHPQFEPAAKWIVERKFRLPAGAAPETPFSILLLDRQYYLRLGACFVRHVRQIHHAEAAEKLSKVNIPFSAQREKLTVHWIRIWRDGEALPQLRSAEDLGLGASVLPNRIAAHLTLEDLRPGDCLDVAYTVKADSLPEHFSAIQPLRQRVPIMDWHLSAIAPPDSQLQISQTAECHAAPVKELSEGSRFHHWHSGDVPAMLQAPSAPDWYQANPEIQLSAFSSWAEVASGLHHAWGIPASCPHSTVAAKTFTEGAGSDPWEAARRACRYVQDQIATLPSRELTLAPADPPHHTLERREGDAKAKACLLVSLMRAIGVPSAPVLVSRSRARNLASALPAPDLFDHVLVRGRIEDADFWVDPCARSEAGRIQDSVLPVYCAGLQIGPKTSKLCAIPSPSQKANQITISEHFTIGADRQASVAITTRSSGAEANRLRAYLAEHGEPTLSSERLAAFERRHPGATRVGDLAIEDNPDVNEIVIGEKFHIPELTPNREDGMRISPAELVRHLPSLPRNANRGAHPLSLPFPCNIRQLTVIDTPLELESSESAEHLPGSGFTISFKGSREGRRHCLRFAYSTHDDHIAPSEFHSAQRRLEKMRPHLDYRIALPAAATTAKAEVGADDRAGKGSRIAKAETPGDGNKLGGRKKPPQSGSGFIRPALAAAAAVALVLLVRGTFRDRAEDTSAAINEEKIAEVNRQEEADAKQRPTPKIISELPKDPLDLLPKLPPLPGPSTLDEVEFGIGDGTTEPEEKASDQKNATSGDWKLGG